MIPEICLPAGIVYVLFAIAGATGLIIFIEGIRFIRWIRRMRKP